MDEQISSDQALASPVLPQSGSKPKRTWLIVLIVFLSLGFLCAAFAVIVIANTVANAQLDNGNTGRYYESILTGNDKSTRVAVIPLIGSINGWGNSLQGEGMVHDLSKKLRWAKSDPSVKVVMLHVDTPGGSVTASDTLYNEIRQLQKAGKKVVACVDDLCASGGYYISAPSDYIVCHPTGMVGSFGVIMFRFELDGLLEKLGIKFAPVKSTNSKDIGSPFRPLTPEEREYFKEILVTIHERFVNIIAEGRKLEKSKVAELANGKIYLAQTALESGLIDEIGYFDSALEKCREFAGSQNAEFIEYDEAPTLLEKLGFKADYSGAPLEKIIGEAARYKLKTVMDGSLQIK